MYIKLSLQAYFYINRTYCIHVITSYSVHIEISNFKRKVCSVRKGNVFLCTICYFLVYFEI